MSTYGKLSIDQPVTTELKLSRENAVVENLEEKDLTETFQLLEKAAKRGDNVGVDEYRNIGDFLESFRFGSAFKVRRPGNEVIDAVITVGPCLAARSIRPCLASLQVFTSEAFARESIWRDCVELAIGFAQQHPFGFSACVTEVFGHCLERITALRMDGFVISASVPRAGKIFYRGGKSPIHMHSYVMYKEIGPVDNKRPRLSEFVNFATSMSNMIDSEGHNYNGSNVSQSAPQSLIPGLPVERFLSAASSTVIVRQLNTTPVEVDRYYDFFRSAAEEGDGFSIEEFPTKELFWKLYKSNYNVVLEDKYSGKWVAIFYIGTSMFSRSRDNFDIADAGEIVAREFRNPGLGAQIIKIVEMAIRNVGYRMVFSDIPVHHIASIAMSVKTGYALSGTLPRAFYSRTYGWSDVVFLSKTFNLMPKF